MFKSAFTGLAFLLVMAGPGIAQNASQGPADHEEHGEGHHHDGAEGAGEDGHHLAEMNGVRALHAWTRATDETSALVFVTIENGSDGIVILEGAESEIADTAELVGFQLQDGEPVYVPLPAVPIQPDREITLAPNGLAIRLVGLDRELTKGDEFEIEFDLYSGHLDMHVQVEAAGATQHSHAGHQH